MYIQGSPWLSGRPGNNIIPQRFPVEEIPYIINSLVVPSDPKPDFGLRISYGVFYHTIYPFYLSVRYKACQMAVFTRLTKRFRFVPSSSVILRKYKLVKVVVVFEDYSEKQNTLWLEKEQLQSSPIQTRPDEFKHSTCTPTTRQKFATTVTNG